MLSELSNWLSIPVARAQQQVDCDPRSLVDSFRCVIDQIGPAAGVTQNQPIDVILTILRTALTLIAILGVIGLIIAGAMYMLAAGDEGQAKKAKSAIMYVIIGLVIIGAAILVVNLIISAF